MSHPFSYRICLSVLTAFALAAVAWAAPDPADSFREETTSVLVEVPVEVTDDGQPLRGLGMANFELFDNGRPQEILAVDVVDLAQLDEGARQELPVAARRHFLLLFDRTFTTPKGFEKARRAAFEFVENDLAPTDLVAVASFSTRNGVTVPLAFTPDRNQVLVAIQQLEEAQAGAAGTRPDPLRLHAGSKLRPIDPGDDTVAGKGGAAGAAALEQALNHSLREQQRSAVEGRREVQILSESMRGLAGLMRQVHGRKHVVFFSEGFDSSLLLGGQNEEEIEQNYQAAALGEVWRVDSDKVFGNRNTMSALDQLTDALRKSDCTLHSVDVAGLRAGGEIGLGAGKKGKDGLFLMARDTGGELFENFNDLGAAMDKLLERTSVTYLLSYRPQDLDFDGKYRKLKVKLKDVPDGRIVHRPGYFAPDGKKSGDDFGTLLASGQQLLDRRKGEVELRLLALPLQQDLGERGRYVPTFVEIGGASFLGPRHLGVIARSAQLRADVFLYAFDRDGGIADFFSQAISLDPAKLGASFAGHGLRLYAPLLLPPGEYTLRALVRDPASGRSGVASARVEVGATVETGGAATGQAATGRAAALLPPMVPDTIDQWLMVRGRRKDLEGQAEPDYPFSFSSQLYAPMAEPRLAERERLPLLVAGWGLSELRLAAVLVDEKGAEVAPLQLAMSGQATVNAAGMIQQLAGFTMPAVGPGAYQVEIQGRDAGDALVASARLPIQVVVAAPAGRQLAFAAPQASGRDLTALALGQAPKPAEDQATIEKSVSGLREQYRQALGSLRPGESREKAIGRLEQFELAALGDDPAGRAPRLGRAELEVARKLAASDAETLLPLLQAHEELYLRHKTGRRPYLELHSRQVVEGLAALYAESGRSEGSKVVASRALSSLGGYLLADGRSASLELFEKATLLDPRNEAAYLGLAAYHEKRGGPYESAMEALQRLVANRPDSREGKLRLAINLLRVAKTGNLGEKAKQRNAAELFNALLAAPENDWVTSLAAQELSRFEFGAGRRSEAIALLEKTLGRRPDDQELMVQLTFYYDRLENARAKSWLERVGRRAEPGEAPRGRYNQWQSEALARDRSELQDGARQRLPILDRALSTTETQEGR
jgi:VWFA-related protein